MSENDTNIETGTETGTNEETTPVGPPAPSSGQNTLIDAIEDQTDILTAIQTALSNQNTILTAINTAMGATRDTVDLIYDHLITPVTPDPGTEGENNGESNETNNGGE